METVKRQDVQNVNVIAEQLHGLAQTLFEYHDKLDSFQLKTISATIYDMSSSVHEWTEKEERIVFKLEEEARND